MLLNEGGRLGFVVVEEEEEQQIPRHRCRQWFFAYNRKKMKQTMIYNNNNLKKPYCYCCFLRLLQPNALLLLLALGIHCVAAAAAAASLSSSDSPSSNNRQILMPPSDNNSSTPSVSLNRKASSPSVSLYINVPTQRKPRDKFSSISSSNLSQFWTSPTIGSVGTDFPLTSTSISKLNSPPSAVGPSPPSPSPFYNFITSSSGVADFGSLFIEAILNGTRTAVERYLLSAPDGSSLCSHLVLKLDNRIVANYSTLQVLMIESQRVHMKIKAAPSFCRLRIVIIGAPLPSIRLQAFSSQTASTSAATSTMTTIGSTQVTQAAQSDTANNATLNLPATSPQSTTAIILFNLTSESQEFLCDLMGDFLGYTNVFVQLQQNATHWQDMYKFRISVARPQPAVHFVLQQSAICILFLANFVVGLQTDFKVFRIALRQASVIVVVALISKLIVMPLICFGLFKLVTFKPELSTAGLFAATFSPSGLEALIHCLLLTTTSCRNDSFSSSSSKSRSNRSSGCSEVMKRNCDDTDNLEDQTPAHTYENNDNNNNNNSSSSNSNQLQLEQQLRLQLRYKAALRQNDKPDGAAIGIASAFASTTSLILASIGWLPLGIYVARTISLPASLIQDAGDKFLFFEYSPPGFEIVPYAALAISLGCLLIPFAIGAVIRHRWRKTACRLRRWFIAITYLALLHLFVSFGFANLAHVYPYISVSTIIGAIVVAYSAAIISALLALSFRQSRHAVVAVAVVVGCPNLTIALHVIQANLEPPATDLSMIVPTLAALIFQIPLFIAEICQAFITNARSARDSSKHHGEEEADHDGAAVVVDDDDEAKSQPSVGENMTLPESQSSSSTNSSSSSSSQSDDRLKGNASSQPQRGRRNQSPAANPYVNDQLQPKDRRSSRTSNGSSRSQRRQHDYASAPRSPPFSSTNTDDECDSGTLPLPSARPSKSALVLPVRKTGSSSGESHRSNKSRSKLIKSRRKGNVSSEDTTDDVGAESASSPNVVRFHPLFSSTSQSMKQAVVEQLSTFSSQNGKKGDEDPTANYVNGHQLKANQQQQQQQQTTPSHRHHHHHHNHHHHEQKQPPQILTAVATSTVKQRFVHFNENNGISVDNVQDWSKLISKTSAPPPLLAASAAAAAAAAAASSTTRQYYRQTQQRPKTKSSSSAVKSPTTGSQSLIPVVLETVV